VVRPPAPSLASAAPRTPAGAQFRFTADASALLGGSRRSRRIVEPDRAGFLVQPPAVPVSAPPPRAGDGARFHVAPVYAAYRNGWETNLRAAVFLAETAPPETSPGVLRMAAVSPRSFALLPALPDRPVARIVMVMGSFLHRGPRPVPQDRVRDRFELPLRPLSFPPAPPRMAYLEGRLHRTDRIGFTPP
jgi:hypothetical protein